MDTFERVRQAEWRLKLARESVPSLIAIYLNSAKPATLHAKITLRGAEAELCAALEAHGAVIDARNAAFHAEMDDMSFDEKAHYFGD